MASQIPNVKPDVLGMIEEIEAQTSADFAAHNQVQERATSKLQETYDRATSKLRKLDEKTGPISKRAIDRMELIFQKTQVLGDLFLEGKPFDVEQRALDEELAREADEGKKDAKVLAEVEMERKAIEAERDKQIHDLQAEAKAASSEISAKSSSVCTAAMKCLEDQMAAYDVARRQRIEELKAESERIRKKAMDNLHEAHERPAKRQKISDQKAVGQMLSPQPSVDHHKEIENLERQISDLEATLKLLESENPDDEQLDFLRVEIFEKKEHLQTLRK